ncbi:hypothetical protein A6M21_16295 [Desulfotomaculum copahuensis]|uniref:CSD domain-containing protein n=1 Tax=Desulfotomaculum copahuensis TaxID=1838280 RepID=A0A1B7LAS6_9FIRM|nr:cold shock domain-containing protein [Desulfotomaculum copahuensis]OAT79321.1 hypothetical protein A6M21_16295 [Desulfotomaculum copahuensis]
MTWPWPFGYGFIKDGNGEQIFFHISGVEDFGSLYEGAEVKFTVRVLTEGKYAGKPMCIGVTKI